MKRNRLNKIFSLGNKVITWALVACLLSPGVALGQRPVSPVPAPGAAGEQQKVELNFQDSPLEMVLKFYSQNLDDKQRTFLIPPGLRANITLKSQTRLSREDAITAIESVLAMNNIAFFPLGEKFIKVTQIAQARQDGMPIQMLLPEEALPETDSLISQMIELKHLTSAEAQPIVQQFLQDRKSVV